MSDQRPEREAIERQLREEAAFWKSRRYGDQGLRESAERVIRIMTEAANVLAALPPTPTPGSVKELREWLRDEAEFAHQKGWNDRAETLMDVEAKCDDVGIVLPPAPTGGRE